MPNPLDTLCLSFFAILLPIAVLVLAIIAIAQRRRGGPS